MQTNKSILSEEDTPKVNSIREKLLNNKNIRERTWSLEKETGIIFHLVEINGVVKVVLEIGDKTTSQNIRETASLALEYRNLLQDFQSDKLFIEMFNNLLNPRNRNELLTQLSFFQGHGMSYSKLAERINSFFSECLKKLFHYQEKSERKTLNFNDLLESQQNTNLISLLIETFYTKDLFERLKVGMDNISRGEAPFEKGYPVSRTKMIEILRYWRKNKYYLAMPKLLSGAEKKK